MIVPVVRIREVRVRMIQRFVPVQMAMFGAGCDGCIVIVLVVFVVDMFMIVHQRAVVMPMFMTLGQMQPGTQRHQGTGYEKLNRGRLTHQNGQHGAEERCYGEVCSGAGSAKMAQPDYE